MMRVSIYFRFFQYLQDELAVPRASIENAIESVGADFNLLPIELWQCQVITIQQLDQADRKSVV